jgi:bifunctional DNase/RNase
LKNIHHLIIANLLPSSVGSSSFILLLESKDNSDLKFPIVIGYNEAQAITIEMEGIKPSRPLTHDLFVNMLNDLSIKIESITITKFVDGIFYAIITVNNTNNTSIDIDSRPSDAVAISLRSKVPIQIASNLLATLSIHDTQIITEANSSQDEEIPNASLSYDDLNNLLNDALVNENYELAAKLRDDISRIKNTNEIK